MGTYVERNIKTEIEANGDITSTTTEKSTRYEKNEEPSYIKIYTKMWCDFNRIPEKYQPLFLALATRMSYADVNNINASQVVLVYGPTATAICNDCGWQTKDPLYKGLKVLVECEAIRKLSKGLYQINPNYAARGSWKFNPKLQNGGVEDLIATFSFKDHNVDTKITWAGDNKTDYDDSYDQNMQSSLLNTKSNAYQTATVKQTQIQQIQGQMSFDNIDHGDLTMFDEAQ